MFWHNNFIGNSKLSLMKKLAYISGFLIVFGTALGCAHPAPPPPPPHPKHGEAPPLPPKPPKPPRP